MRILYLAQEPELHEGDVVTGNAVRAHQLAGAMRRAGHAIDHVWLAGPDAAADRRAGAFRNRDQLQALILHRRPDVIVVAYWELLALLPFTSSQPVVLDFVAPRPLEALYQDPAATPGQIRRLRAHLRRCDLVLVGNDRQGRLLTLTLIEAGFDLREQLPLLTVPLGAECVEPAARHAAGERWLFVTGGVRWPWRRQDAWLEALSSGIAEAGLDARVVTFEGPYRRAPQSGSPSARPDTAGPAHVQHRPLLPYGEYSAFLSLQAHVGVELAERNIEREHSQSFRSLDFLRHGLPLLCNSWLPIAALVQRYDAGWCVDSPTDLTDWTRALAGQPEAWQHKSRGALRLAREALDPDRLAAPLLQWLDAPAPARRLPLPCVRCAVEPVLGVPPLRERLRRQLRLSHRSIMLRLTGLRRPAAGVVIVTRGDLFPADHGAAVRTIETARALGELGMDVAIVTDDAVAWYHWKDGCFERRRFPWWLHLLSLPAPAVKLLHHSKDLPHSNRFLYLPLTDRGFYWRTLVAAHAVRAAILQAEFPAYAAPCLRVRDAVGSRVVLVEHNVEYARLRNQVASLTGDQYQRLRSIEIDLCSRADAVVCVSDNDRQRLIDDGVDPAHLVTIPHGVRLSDYQEPAKPLLRERFGVEDGQALLAFHGTFSYPPNRQAVDVFADTLLPALERAGVVAHVLAVGRDPLPSSPHPRIHFTGSVTRVAPWLKACDLAVIPLTEGGGTRMKIVDCFAAGLPVVSTSKGIEGIPVEPGRQAIIADDWDAMAAAIVRLWRQPDAREALAAAGLNLARSLDWSAIAQRYRKLYSGLPT